VLNSYDIVGVNPVNEKEFKQCCSKLECDIIWLNLFEKLPFFLKRPPIKEAIERGIHFEIRYSDSLRDSTKRKYLIQNAMSLVKYTKVFIKYSILFYCAIDFFQGKNIIISSGTYDPIFQRSPNDLIHM
jgi:RNase P/RNase MRP subunit p30